MQQELQLRGEGNRVVTLFGRVYERSWSEIAAKPYALSAESWYPADAVPPRAALFVVGDMEHWYASAADDAAHAAWFAATDSGRETAICLKHPGGRELPSTMPGVDDGGDLPCRAIDGISEVRTITYGTHGATTRLEILPASREPIPGTIWLPGWAWDPRRQIWDSRRPGYVWTGEVTGITRYLTHHDLFVAPTSPPEGIDSGQRWLTPHAPGSWLWWRLMAFSLRTPGHDVVCVEPDHRDHNYGATKMGPTAMAATARQWSWFGDAWRNEVDGLDLQHVVIVEGERSSTTEQLLAQAFPRARVTYGFV